MNNRRKILQPIPVPKDKQEIILSDALGGQDSRKICVVVNDKKNIIYFCIFSSVSKKKKNGKNKIFPIPAEAKKLCIIVTQAGGRKKNIKINFI